MRGSPPSPTTEEPQNKEVGQGHIQIDIEIPLQAVLKRLEGAIICPVSDGNLQKQKVVEYLRLGIHAGFDSEKRVRPSAETTVFHRSARVGIYEVIGERASRWR